MLLRMFCTIVLVLVSVTLPAWGQTGGTASQASPPSDGQKEGQRKETKQAPKNKPSRATGELEERPAAVRNMPPLSQVVPQSAPMTANAETLSGTLTIVDPEKKLVVLMTSDGVSYDFVADAATKIIVGGNKATLEDLSSQINRQACVAFVAMNRKGDIARSIEVTQ